MAYVGAGSGLEGNSSNPHLHVFESNYVRLTALPIDAMLPTFLSKQMLRDDMLRGRIRSAPSNPEKAQLLLDPVYVNLKLCNNDLFMKLLDVMTTYADGSDDQQVTSLVRDIKKELTPQQEVNVQNHPGEMVVRRHVLSKDLIPQFKGTFAINCNEMMKATGSYIKQQHIPINDVVNMLCTFKNGHTVFSDDEFIKSWSFNQISRAVLRRTTIYDYSALEFFVNIVKCQQAQEILRDFVKHFENSLMKELNLLDDHEIYTSRNYNKMSFGDDQPLMIIYKGYSLSYDDQELIKKFACEMFELVDFSVTFERIALGSIALIYRTSDSVRRYLLEYRITACKLASCAKYDISHFIIGDFELKVPLEDTITDEDAVVQWTRIARDSPETDLPELVLESDDLMHPVSSSIVDVQSKPTLLYWEEGRILSPENILVPEEETVNATHVHVQGVQEALEETLEDTVTLPPVQKIKRFVTEFPAVFELIDQTSHFHPQYGITTYHQPAVFSDPILQHSVVPGLRPTSPIGGGKPEQLLVGVFVLPESVDRIH